MQHRYTCLALLAIVFIAAGGTSEEGFWATHDIGIHVQQRQVIAGGPGVEIPLSGLFVHPWATSYTEHLLLYVYAHWCRHCVASHGVWDEVSSAIQHSPTLLTHVSPVVLDIGGEGSAGTVSFRRQIGVSELPQVLLIVRNGTVVRYGADITDGDGVVQWLLQALPEQVRFEYEAEKNDHITRMLRLDGAG